MTAAAPPLTEPFHDEAGDTAFPPCGEGEEWARGMLRRELEVLGELAELGLRMARPIVAQASGDAAAGPPVAEPVVQGDLPLAFSRVSRAARMAVLLQAKLIQDIKAGGRKAAPGDDDEDEGPEQWRVEWVPEDDPSWADGEDVRCRAETRGERAERRESEARERLERDDIYAAVMGRPREEVIERIREDLGVRTAPIAVAMAGSESIAGDRSDGPPADPGAKPGEERGVEGTIHAHHAPASPVTDSS